MSDVVVETSKGRLRGTTTDTGVAVFKGVPYAAPPVGARRFRPPQAVEPWTGERDARDFGPSCPQPSQRPAGWTQESAESEDCLYLNVWSKGVASDATRPVLVWIHGGGYSIGSGSWPIYDGANLAAKGDVVVVTVNHRLGPLGYLHLDGAIDGNNGQLDLIAVLEWVRDEIAAFGGDAGNVTVFGESGGSPRSACSTPCPPPADCSTAPSCRAGPAFA
jgi:para-nitrobenzyl esterase